jgi:hypothetical protein
MSSFAGQLNREVQFRLCMGSISDQDLKQSFAKLRANLYQGKQLNVHLSFLWHH